MNLCSDDHEEVCYESRKCPACDMKGERDDIQEKLDEAKNEIAELRNELNEK